MEALHRIAFVVRPKRRYVEWANSLDLEGPPLTIEGVRTDPSVYLVAPDDDEQMDTRDLIELYATEMFEAQLSAWEEDESRWPVNRTPHVFRDWFDIDVAEEVQDLDDDEPLVPETVFDADEAIRSCGWCARDLGEDETPLPVQAELSTDPDFEIPEGVAYAWPIPTERGFALMTRSESERVPSGGHVLATFWACSDECATALGEGLAAQEAQVSAERAARTGHSS